MKINRIVVGVGAVTGMLMILVGVKELWSKKEKCVKCEDGLELMDIFINMDDMLTEIPVSLLSAINTLKDELYNKVGEMHYEYYDPVRDAAHFSELTFGTECIVYRDTYGCVNYRFGGSYV